MNLQSIFTFNLGFVAMYGNVEMIKDKILAPNLTHSGNPNSCLCPCAYIYDQPTTEISGMTGIPCDQLVLISVQLETETGGRWWRWGDGCNGEASCSESSTQFKLRGQSKRSHTFYLLTLFWFQPQSRFSLTMTQGFLVWH